MKRRKADWFLLLVALGVGLVAYSLLDARRQVSDGAQRIATERALVRSLGLTDPALFTEARYTRHLTQADGHAPFQDHPLALEHFPSGSLVYPPGHSAR